nr:transcription factor SOX 6 [Hymenolepis microstoma]
MEYTDLNSPLHYMNACKQCVITIDDGVESFIAHLTSEHAIPTEWPSDRASRLTGDEAKKPYTTIAATRKKRRKLTTPRPLNSFMIFAQHIRRNVLAIFETASSSNISRLLGQAWSKIPKEIRAAYDEEAARLSKIHNKEFPTYKYQPRPRHSQCCNGTAVSPRVDMDIDEDYDNDLSLPTQVPPLFTSSLSANPTFSSARLSISIPNSAQLSSSTAEQRLPSPLKLKPEPPSPTSTNSSSPFLSSSNSSNFKLKLSIPDIRPPRLAKRPSKFLKIAPVKISPKLPANSGDTQNNRSSPCLSTSSPPSRTPSPAQQLTPNHENIVPPAVSSSSIVQNTEVTSVQQRTAETLATLHKLLNQATAQQQQNQQQAQLQNQLQQQLQQQFQAAGREQNLSSSSGSSKPCILLTPLQSEIGQQAIISCTQSATIPTLLTCGNTIYVALTVMHAPVVQNPIGIRNQDNQAVEMTTSPPQRQLVANQTPLLGSELMDLLRAMDANQARSNTECRLTELLQAALTAAAMPTATTSQ